MTLEQYTLEIAEDESHEGITADVYGETGVVEESTRVTYTDYGLRAVRDDWSPSRRRQSVTMDVTRVNLQYERDGEAFEFRLLGDDDVVATERVTDEEWKVATDGD